jgi:hypothetical protein
MVQAERRRDHVTIEQVAAVTARSPAKATGWAQSEHPAGHARLLSARLRSSTPLREPVSTRRPRGHPERPRTPSPSQEPRTSRTTSEREDARARNQLAKLHVQESSRKRTTGIGRWIEAKRFGGVSKSARPFIRLRRSWVLMPAYSPISPEFPSGLSPIFSHSDIAPAASGSRLVRS